MFSGSLRRAVFRIIHGLGRRHRYTDTGTALVVQSGRCRGLVARLAAVGRLALTDYLGTTVICTTLFNGYGFGLFGRLERYQLYAVVLGAWLFWLLVSPVWFRVFRFGPMEWLWRSLTY